MTLLRTTLLALLSLLFYSAVAQPELWGTTPFGGKTGNGTIFSLKNSKLSSHYSFSTLQTGETPWYEKLVQAANGKLYGVTKGGGVNGGGVIYEYDLTTKSYTLLHSFDYIAGKNGSDPIGGLVEASNGKLYGTAAGGELGGGILFEYDITSQKFSIVHDFGYDTGYAPGSYLIEGDNNTLLGVAAIGGKNDGGVIFEFNYISKEYKSKFDFSYENGITPRSGLMRASNGKFYGMTEKGGLDDKGVIYEYDQSSSEFVVKRSFGSNSDGAYVSGSNPFSLMVEHPNGKLYGVTPRGGAWGVGTLFEYDLVNNLVTLKTEFSILGGASPVGGLTVASNGKLYGMTKDDEIYSTLKCDFYEYDVVTGIFKTDINYTPSTRCTLLQASDGKLYGVTENSGDNSKGEFFSIDPLNPVYNVVFPFGTSPDGANPYGHLTQAYNGKLYGMTNVGGLDHNGGVIFEFDPISKVYTKKIDLHGLLQFKPYGGFTLHPNGKLYGMITYAGKIYALGAIIEFDPQTGSITNNLPFDEAGGEISQKTYGQYPFGDLLLAPNGKMYALASEGGVNGTGTLLEYNPTTHSLIKKFDFNDAIGKKPKGSLALSANGKLYGTTSEGGSNNFGTLFEYDIALNKVTKKADFTASTGVHPEGWMTLANDNKLYGLSKEGGPDGIGAGLIYQFDPTTSELSAAYYFSVPEVFRPLSSFIALPDGKLYAYTQYGGDNRMGAVISFEPAKNEVSVLHSFDGLDGANPMYNSLITIKKEQSVTISSTTIHKIYGDQPVSLASAGLSSSSGLPVQSWSTDPNIADVVDGMIVIKGAGIVDIVVSQLGNSEYLPATSKTLQVDVSKATLTITAPQVSKVYGESLPDLNLEYAGFVEPDTKENLDVTPTTTCSASVKSDVGSYSIIVVTGSDKNYNFTTVNGSLAITPAAQTITFDPLEEKSFGDTPIELNATSSSGLDVVYASSNNNFLSIKGKVATIVNAGEVQITASQPGNTNYFAATNVVQTLKIKRIVLGVEAYKKNVTAFPIPTTGTLFLDGINQNITKPIQIVDLVGKVVLEVCVKENEPIDVTALPSGIYLLKCSSGTIRIEKL